jgi:D-amino-acid dehydrogenase
VAKHAADVVVVGAGVVGLCSGLHLLRAGRSVLVVERDRPGAGASGHNGGIFAAGECVPTATGSVLRSVPRMLLDPDSALALRWSYLPRVLPWLLRFAAAARPAAVERISIALQSLTARSLAAYRDLIGDSPAGEQIRSSGYLHAYLSDEVFRALSAEHELRVRRGVAMRVLDGAGVGKLDPGLAGRFRRGVHMLDAGSTTDPERLTQSIAQELVARGGRMLQARVTGFEVSDGRVPTVKTDAGDVSAGQVVIAAGAWSRRLIRPLGHDVPLDTERGYGLYLPQARLPVTVPLVVVDHHFSMTASDAGVRITAISELAGLDAPPNPSLWDRTLRAARTVFPELRAESSVRWMSYRPSTPDSLPVIGRLPGCDKVVLAFGHGHKGLALGAVTGQLVAELAEGRSPSVDLAPFSPTRFRWHR